MKRERGEKEEGVETSVNNTMLLFPHHALGNSINPEQFPIKRFAGNALATKSTKQMRQAEDCRELLEGVPRILPAVVATMAVTVPSRRWIGMAIRLGLAWRPKPRGRRIVFMTFLCCKNNGEDDKIELTCVQPIQASSSKFKLVQAVVRG